MRIYLEDSSSSSAASASSSLSIGDELPDDAGPSFHASSSAQSLGTTPTRAARRPTTLSMRQSSSSSTPLLDDHTPDAKSMSHLERANQARKLSLGSKARNFSRGKSPMWMRSRTASSKGARDGAAMSSDEDLGGSFRSDDSHSDFSDSEEDEWPNGPRRATSHTGQRGNGIRSTQNTLLLSREVAERVRLSGLADQISPSRTGSLSRRLRTFSPRPFELPATLSKSDKGAEQAKADLDQVQNLLNNLRLKKEQEEATERREFEARNRALWDSIEEGIRKAEEEREKVQRESQERERKAREQREAAERRAKEAREAEEAKATKEKEEAEKRKREQEEQAAKEAKAEEERLQQEKARNVGGVGVNLDREAKEQFDSWWSKMSHIKANVLPVVSQNAEWRKQCFTAKRSITRGVSQLTNSQAEIVRITTSIGEVLTQAKGAVSTGEIYTWILNHLSKCLIRQAEQEVAAKQDTAFPLARVVSWLLLQGHAEFGDVLMARLIKKCCWCLPYCPGKKPGQDEASFAKLLGKANVEEAAFAYTTRMTGIVAFYFAICQTTPSSPPGSSSDALDVSRIPDHFRVKGLWTWMARAMSPRILDQTLSPALWSALIEVGGPVLLATYGRQTGKVWNLMLKEGIIEEKAGFCKTQAANSAKVRLKQLLEDVSKTGQVQGATEGRETNA